MIIKTEAITFPRSGHHLLVNLLSHYFGSDLHYSEFYTSPETALDFCPETNLQKNHDFDLITPIVPGRNYIVQIRDPFEAISSLQIMHHTQDDEDYFSRTLDYYVEFVRKWIVSPIPNRLIIHYRNLIETPFSALSRTVSHLTLEPPDNLRIHKAVHAAGITRRDGVKASFPNFSIQ